MPELAFDCTDVRADPYAAGPTLIFRLRVTESSGERVHALALRCQLRIQPHKRRHSPAEMNRLKDLFGAPSRWADTVKPIQLAEAAVVTPSFTGSVDVDVPVSCTYDMEIAATSYLAALEGGAVPVVLLFSGTVITRGDSGFAIAQVPWHKEASCALPVAVWRSMMDAFFPDSGWLRLSRDALDALRVEKNARTLPSYEQTIRALLHASAGVAP
jgi:hypothetical protein